MGNDTDATAETSTVGRAPLSSANNVVDDDDDISIDTSGSDAAGPTREEIAEVQAKAWYITAKRYGYQPPSIDEVKITINLEPTEVITRLFAWTSEEDEIMTIVSTLENAIQDACQPLADKYKIPITNFSFFNRINKKDGEDNVDTATAFGPSGDELYKITFDAWTALAQKYGYALPDEEQVTFAMTVGPEEAIITGFEWVSGRDSGNKLQKLIFDYKNELQGRRSKLYNNTNNSNTRNASISTSSDIGSTLISQKSSEEDDGRIFRIIPGVKEWIESLIDAEMQCGIVSYLEYDQVNVLLNMAGLADLFPKEKIVSLSNNYRRDSDQLLGCSLRLERRPDHCVVFDTTSLSSDAAHMVDMRSVGMIGIYPRYDLLSADTTTSSFSELTAMNVRRLFSERIYDQPQQDMQQIDPSRVRNPKTKFFWAGDDY